MSDYLNNLLARSFAAPAHNEGLVVPRRWNEYEAQTWELPQTPAESSQDGYLDRWSEDKESPALKEVVEQSPANFPVSPVENHQIANKAELPLPGIAPSGEVAPQSIVSPNAITIPMPQQFENKIARNVLPLPFAAKVTTPVDRREIPLSASATTPHLASRQVIPPFMEREVLITPPALPVPPIVKAKSPEALIPIKADPTPRNVQVIEMPTAVRTPSTNNESAIKPIVAPSIIMSAANQARSATPVETVINVTIGRVEVRASQAPAPPVRKLPSAATMSLDDYLQKRNGGRG